MVENETEISNEAEMALVLKCALDGSIDLAEVDALVQCRTKTYAEGGYGTMNEGFVVRLADGSEYQITVVRSR